MTVSESSRHGPGWVHPLLCWTKRVSVHVRTVAVVVEVVAAAAEVAIKGVGAKQLLSLHTLLLERQAPEIWPGATAPAACWETAGG